MSLDRDLDDNRLGGDARKADRQAPTPGKHTNTESLETGMLGPSPGVPGKRSATETLEPGSNGSPLPTVLRAQFEGSLGVSLADVRVHTDERAARRAQQVNARAFATGSSIFFAAGQYAPGTAEGDRILAEEVAHTVQQRGAPPLPAAELRTTEPGDAAETEADHAAHLMLAGQPARVSSKPRAMARFGGPFGGFGGPISGTPLGSVIGSSSSTSDTPQWKKTAGPARDYVKKHGKDIIDGLRSMLSNAPFVTGVEGVSWKGDSPSSFNEGFNLEFFKQKDDPWTFLVTSLAPVNVEHLVDKGRDAIAMPEMAMQYNNGVIFELTKAYQLQISQSLKRVVPRYAMVWNQQVLLLEAMPDPSGKPRKKDDPLPISPEPAETDIRAGHPNDLYVARALRGRLSVDFRKYRDTYKSEQGQHPISKLQKVTLEIQWQQKAINWARAKEPGATAEDVAAELYGAETFAYLITPAPPLFGFDTSFENKAKLKQSYQDQLTKIQGDPNYHGSVVGPGFVTTPEQQILGGPLGDEAALNQAKNIKPTPGITKAAVVERMRHIVGELTWMQKSVERWKLQGSLDAAKKKVDERSRDIDKSGDPAAGAAWDGQTQAQLQVLSACRNAVQMAAKQEEAFKSFSSAAALVNQLVREYVEAAAISDLTESAKTKLAAADDKSKVFPAELMDAVLTDLRPVIASAKVVKNKSEGTVGNHDSSRYDSGNLEKKENELRFRLTKLRTTLLQNPDKAKEELEAVLKELTSLTTEVSLVSNMDSCDAAFAALEASMSKIGAVVSAVSDNHGNKPLKDDQADLLMFKQEWKTIYDGWKAAKTPEDKKKWEDALKKKASSPGWTELFNRIRSHIKDKETLDKWVTFGVMVGIALVTGGIGAYVEVAAGAAWGAAAGFAASTVVEAATFSALTQVLVTKDASLASFYNDFENNIVMFGGLKAITKVYGVGAAAMGINAAEGVGKAGGILVQYMALNGHALHEADKQKRAANNGQGLTEDEILSISFENLAFLVALSIGAHLGKPFLEGIVATGKLHGLLIAEGRASKQAAQLAKDVEASKGKDPKKAEALNKKLAEALAKREEALKALEKDVKAYEGGDKTVLSEKDYNKIKEAMGDHEAKKLAFVRAQIQRVLEPAGPNNFNVDKAATQRVLDHYKSVEKDAVVVQIGEPDPVTGARTFEITPKDQAPFRVTERMSAKEGELNKAPDATPAAAGAKPPATATAEAEALHQEALRARSEMIKRSGQLAGFIQALSSSGHVLKKFSRLIAGNGPAAAQNANTLPGSSKGAEPPPLTGAPDVISLATGSDTFSKLGETTIGQKAPELDGKGWAVQPSQLTPDHKNYTSAMTLADATALTQYRSGVPVLDAVVLGTELRPEGPPSADWKVADANVRVKIRTKTGELYLYGDSTDIATGLGEPNKLALKDINADATKAKSYQQTLEQSGRMVYGDDPSVQKAGKVLVSGGSATAAWNVEIARKLGALVDWVATVMDPRPPQMEAAKKEFLENKDKLEKGGLSPEEVERLTKRQTELQAFGAAMLPRNLETKTAPFKDTGAKRMVKGIRSVTPTEEIPGEAAGKVKVEFTDGSSGIYDQVVVSHSTDTNVGPDGGAGAFKLVSPTVELRPVVVDGMVVALESVNPPGAIRVMGSVMWVRSATWVKYMTPASAEVYMNAVANQAATAPRDSPANPLVHNVNKQIPLANKPLGGSGP